MAASEAVAEEEIMEISAKAVQELRARTNAGIMDCKKALLECDGDMDKAVEWLQKKGIAAATKRAGRIASEGLMHSYIHGGRIGVLIEVNCETDFVAKTPDFKEFVNDVALHIAAMNPPYLQAEDIPAAELASQQAIFEAQAAESGKPAQILGKIVEGKIKKWVEESCLLTQKFVKDPEKTIEQVRLEVSVKTGEKVSIRRFTRWELGEGLEKRTNDLAADVAAQIK